MSAGAGETARHVLGALPPWRVGVTDLPHAHIVPAATYAPWHDDVDFRAICEAIKGHTLVDRLRLWELWCLARQCATPAAGILEVGVWRGGSGAVMAAAVRDWGVPVWLCDTFAGVALAGPADAHYRGGEHADADAVTVAALCARLALDVRILSGVFPSETADAIPAEARFGVVHIDVDVHDGAREIAAWAWPRLVTGGVIVWDDYGFQSTSGVTTAVDALWPTLPGARFVHNLNGHGIAIKVGAT